MEPAAKTVFISYSRADGRDFAEALQARLAAADLTAWRDLESMGPGDIRPQVLRAIKESKHLVLILSRRACVSDWIKREWSHARFIGIKVSPVLADPTLTRADLPAWMTREEVFDIDPARDRNNERWNALLLALRGNGQVKRVPYMPGDVPATYVPRPTEFTTLKTAILAETPDRSSGQTVGLTTALRGAGGYGKTTLANAICRDPDIRFEFSDGVLRVEIGKERNDVTPLLSDLIEKLDPDGKRPGFADPVTASEHLGELLGESRLLLVVDDVWRETQLRPFLRGGPNCVRLVTTRVANALPPDARLVEVDELRPAESASLLAKDLPTDPATTHRLATFAQKLGHWAQILAIANAWLRDRVRQGEPLPEAIRKFESRLVRKGPFAFDPADERQRNKALRLCIEASVEDLLSSDINCFAELAIFSEDEDIPLATIVLLWRQTAAMDEDGADDILDRLKARSLLQSLDRASRTLRLHDNILWYLRDHLGHARLRETHAVLVETIRGAYPGSWPTLPVTETYAWRHLIRHLRGAGDDATADALLGDYAWIKAKLFATDARSLLADYIWATGDPRVRLIGRAIALSLSALTTSKRDLPLQLYGRVGDIELFPTDVLRGEAIFLPNPRWPGLTPPGAELFCLRGHEDSVESANFSPDGVRVVTASTDKTARVWSTMTGAELGVLRGHGGAVNSAVFSPDGSVVLTTSADGTSRAWDPVTEITSTVFYGHEGGVNGASYSEDGCRIATASDDQTARVWDASSGVGLLVLRGHYVEMGNADFSPNGKLLVTSSKVRTPKIAVVFGSSTPGADDEISVAHDLAVCVWDANSGAKLHTFESAGGRLRRAIFSPDGGLILALADDYTIRLLKSDCGSEQMCLPGHDQTIYMAAFANDSKQIVTASGDKTACIWDTATGRKSGVLRGHEDTVNSAAFSPDRTQIVTAARDRTARIWDMTSNYPPVNRRGHADWVFRVAFSSDGLLLATCAADTASVWDSRQGDRTANLGGLYIEDISLCRGAAIGICVESTTLYVVEITTGAKLLSLGAHERWPKSSISRDGRRVVTWDGRVRVWDAESGLQLVSYCGPEHQPNDFSFSPDNSRLLVADGEVVHICNASVDDELATLVGHTDWVHSANFSPSGAQIVTASRDGTIRIWDSATGAEIAHQTGHSDFVRCARFSSSGTCILTASDDRTCRIWDVATAGELARINLDAAVTALDVHGTAIALGDALGRIHVYDAEEILA